MSALWTSAGAVAASGGRSTQTWAATGVSIDTRTLDPGDLFVALTDQRDGHDFVAQALEKGAAAAMVSRLPEGVPDTAPLLIVDDVLSGLEALARAARARTEARVIAVTGSVGKTSTKEMLRTALSAQGRTHAAEKSYNNHWGVPLTLARMPQETEFAVIEIGMNAPGEIAPLSRLARPHVGLITTVAAVHLEAFAGLEAIAAEKGALAEGLEPGGTMVLNADIATLPILLDRAGEARIVTFGEAAGADFRLSKLCLTETALTVRADCGGDVHIFKLSAPGRHLAMNALGALAAVAAAGGDLPTATLALASWSAQDGRGARWDIVLGPGGIDGTIRLIDESYNANPAAMAAALEVFATITPQNDVGRVSRGRRIAFLADMLELGPTAGQLHAGLADLEAIGAVDTVHCAGPLMRNLHEALAPRQRGQWRETTAELAAAAPKLVDAGDVVMCKGSNGSKTRLLVEAIKKLGAAEPLNG